MSYTPETAISAVTWPNGWGEGAHGINAACIQLGVKTLADLDALMEDPERQKKFKTAISDRSGPFNFAFNLADKVCATGPKQGAQAFNSSDNEFARRKAEETKPAPKFPKAPAPRPTETEDPDEDGTDEADPLVIELRENTRAGTVATLLGIVKRVAGGSSLADASLAGGKAKNYASNMAGRIPPFRKLLDRAREETASNTRDDVASTPPVVVADNADADECNEQHGDRYGTDWVYPSGPKKGDTPDETEPFPPHPEPDFENEDDLPAIEDGPADATTFCKSCGGGVNENGNRVHHPTCPKRPTDKLVKSGAGSTKFLSTEEAEGFHPITGEMKMNVDAALVHPRQRNIDNRLEEFASAFLRLEEPLLDIHRWCEPAERPEAPSAVNFLERQIVAHVVSAAKTEYSLLEIDRGRLALLGALLITARAEEEEAARA